MGNIKDKTDENIIKDNENRLDYLEIIDNISGAIGSKDDKEIEQATMDLLDLKEYVSKIEQERKDSINRENAQNETILNLRKANNKLMRQVASRDPKQEEFTAEEKRINVLDNIF